MGPAVAPSNDMKVLVSLDPSGVSAGAICGHGSGPKTLPKTLAFDVLVAAAAIAAVIVAVDVFAVFCICFLLCSTTRRTGDASAVWGVFYFLGRLCLHGPGNLQF